MKYERISRNLTEVKLAIAAQNILVEINLIMFKGFRKINKIPSELYDMGFVVGMLKKVFHSTKELKKASVKKHEFNFVKTNCSFKLLKSAKTTAFSQNLNNRR